MQPPGLRRQTPWTRPSAWGFSRLILVLGLVLGGMGGGWTGRCSDTVTAPQGSSSVALTIPPARSKGTRAETVNESANRTQSSTNQTAFAGALVIPSSGPEPRILIPINGPGRQSSPAVTNATPLTNAFAISNAASSSLFSDRVLTAQVVLVRRGISPGPIDATIGPQTRAALRAFQEQEKLSVSGRLDAATEAKLTVDAPLYTNYVVAEEDLARLLPLGQTWLAKSEQERLDFETVLELVAEKSHSNPRLLRWLNPEVNWTNIAPGTALKVVQAEYPVSASRAAFVRILLNDRKLQAFDENTNLLAHFPCSVAARVDKRPVGEALHISVVAPNPNYTFDPEVFPESEEARQLGRKLILQPGPNNPVGTVWLGLDKPGYGIHGTPRPEEVGRTESHGCFRLANWNAEYLLKLVTVGTPVFVEP